MIESPLMPLLMISCGIKNRLNANETIVDPMMIPAVFTKDSSKIQCSLGLLYR
jgi:hypothetical protein